jgi:hypothetical protein
MLLAIVVQMLVRTSVWSNSNWQATALAAQSSATAQTMPPPVDILATLTQMSGTWDPSVSFSDYRQFNPYLTLEAGERLAFMSDGVVALPLEWPIPPITNAQVEEVRECDYRLPDDVEYWSYGTGPLPNYTVCQWAGTAVGRGSLRFDLTIGERLIAFGKAFEANPAYAFSPQLISHYYGDIPLVENPPFISHEITEIELQYDAGTFGSTQKFDVTITQANTNPLVTGNSKQHYEDAAHSITGTVRVPTVQALRYAFDNLLPVRDEFKVNDCCDYYPKWGATIHFDDGRGVFVTTGSNRVFHGGPLQFKIDDAYYMQYSPSMILAIADIFYELGLKPTSAEPHVPRYSEKLDDPLIDYLFP